MLRSFLLGLAGGMRSMTPLAAVAIAAHDRKLPENDAPIALLGHPLVVAGTVALAAGELIGDKIPRRPIASLPRALPHGSPPAPSPAPPLPPATSGWPARRWAFSVRWPPPI